MSDRPSPGGWLPDEIEEGINEDFLFHFYQGGELLRIGKLPEALAFIEKAAELKPDNSKCQNLLGLIHFKLGNFQESIGIYRDLIERNPEEETLRVNLATVFIRAGRLDEAEEELLEAIELKPGYLKAHRTLAVILLKKGQKDRARLHLERAGIEEHDRLLDLEPSEQENLVPAGELEAGWMVGEDPAVPGRAATELHDGAPFVSPATEAIALDTMPFRTEGGCLSGHSSGCLFARMDTLVWVKGDFSFAPVKKRFGGGETKYPFGSGDRTMVRVEGIGSLFFSPEASEYHVHTQGNEPGYFIEDLVFAFSNAERWENGRLQSGEGAEVPVFHILGPAQVVLNFTGKLRRRPVDETDKLLISVHKLVGWSGSIVPRLIEVAPPLPHGLWIELTGQGRVLYTI
jgi:hypothetical protein